MNNSEIQSALNEISNGERIHNMVQPYETMKTLVQILHESSYVTENRDGISILTGSSKSRVEGAINEALNELSNHRNIENRNQNAINSI